MKLDDAIKIGLGLQTVSLNQMQEAVATLAAELEMLRIQEPIARVDCAHEHFIKWSNSKKINDFPVGTKLYAYPVVAVKPKQDSQAALTTIYDWSKAPEWAEWAATDDNGCSWFHSKKPRLSSSAWAMAFGDGARCSLFGEFMNVQDWRYSLEQRPHTANKPVVTNKENNNQEMTNKIREAIIALGAIFPKTIGFVVEVPLDKPVRFVETNAHEIDLQRIQCVSLP